MAKKRQVKNKEKGVDYYISEKGNELKDNTLWAFLATFLSIIGFLLVLIRKEKSNYVRFYAGQSLVVFIASVIVGLVGWIVGWIPILGDIIKVGLSIIVILLWVLSWINALSGSIKEVPIIGHYGREIKL